MPQLIWLPEALADVERLHHFLKSKNANAAARAAGVILNGANLLAISPEIGRLMPDDSKRRELFMPFASGAYVLRYTIDSTGKVIIIRVWHSRENRAD